MRKLVVSGAQGDREVPLTETVTVGRDPACAVSDDDPQLSRRHAEFVAGRDGVVVRDLNSRNGIRVNDVKTREATLRSGDLIQIARFRIRYLDDAAAAPTGAPPADGAAPGAAPAVEGDDDQTRMVAPPPRTTSDPPAAAPVAAEAAPPADDQTRVLSLPGPAPTGPPPRPVVPVAAETPERAAARPAARAPVRRGRGAWGVRLVLAVTLLAVSVCTVTALIMLSWSERRANATAEARAVALGQWLAAEASLEIRAGRDVGQAVTRLGQEPGVMDAVVIRPEDGRVMAPPSRATERVEKLPGLGVAPSEVWRVQAVRHGGLVEVVAPVATPTGPRGAVAWLRFQPSAAGGAGGSSALVLIPALLLAFGLAMTVATVIRRSTERALAAFNEDVELAVSGRLAQVTDPMGIKPLKDLAETLNYLLVRVRGAERGGPRPAPPPGRPERAGPAGAPIRRAEAAGPAPPRDPGPRARPSAPASGGDLTGRLDRAPGEAPASASPAPPPSPLRRLPPAVRIVASAAYRVTEVGPECVEVLDVRPDAMVGQHLLDAVPDKGVVDAVLRCLSALAPAGEERTSVEPAGKDYQLDVAVRRTGRDQPVTIVLTPAESHGP